MDLVSNADMTRFCRSAAYREWASQLGLGVPVIFGGEGAPLANKKPAIKPRGRGGRKPGSGAYAAKDCVLWIEMKSVMGRGEATSVWDAARQFAGKAPGATFDSKRRRLVKGYNNWISTQ